MKKRETNLTNRILAKHGARPDVRLWRNATFTGWVGKCIGQFGSRVVLDPGTQIQGGLCVGSPDIVGIGPGGRFVGMEVKTGKLTATAKQKRFIAQIRALGGIAGVVRSVEDATALLGDENGNARKAE